MKHIITLLAIFVKLFCFSQNIWESSGISNNNWISSGALNIQKYSNCISIKNTTPIVYQDKGITISSAEEYAILTYNYPSVGIATNEFSQAFELTFDVENLTFPKGASIPGWPGFTYQRFSFWSIDLIYIDNNNSQQTKKIYVIRTDGNPEYEYGYDLTSRRMSTYKDGIIPVRKIKIYYNSSICEVHISGSTIAILDDIKSIKDIRISIAGDTNLKISNTACSVMTKYGLALSYIQKATEYLYSNAPLASNEMTIAIEKGFGCYDTYLIRGIAYYNQGYYKSAIEDLTAAINYASNNKEKAYFYRGISKLALDDDKGIYDLRNGGQDGLVFLRENNLLNYVPGQGKKNANTQKRDISSRPKKAALKK